MKAHLRARKPEYAGEEGGSLGAQLRRRRRERGLLRCQAAEMIGVDPKSLMWWERDIRLPADRFYPAIVAFLGHEPWPEPLTLGEALVAERRRRGLSIDRAAALIGVEEGTFGRWERADWKPTSLTRPAIDRFLGFSSRQQFPNEVR